ncbi:MAG: aminotransferase class I/II-fold pyridoxal phosphate-dependent enzyme [Lentisphaeria bacterium]|nr:aminotransferase class I/II-fold pyridoxal phosphate-dependent enzyme [Lentisphaeria bacterium]
MTEPQETPPVRSFADFAAGNGTGDILDKVHALDRYLQSSPRAYLEGLGLPLLDPPSPRTRIREPDGSPHRVIMLGSNSYLGLTTHPRVVAAARDACSRFGYGMGAVPLYAGTTELHCRLESLIAAFYGAEDAILFPCGYSGNIGVLSALCGPGDVILNDAANHASIFDGCRLSGADIKVYLHRNLRSLERHLERLPPAQRGRLIVTDGVFSMDGDVAPLDEIVALARRYGARVMIDEAHALGIIGATGRGTAEYRGCPGRVDITYGTLSKAPGAVGGYCAGSAALVRYLRYYARTHFFSTSLPPPVVAGLIEVFQLLAADAAGRKELWENVHYLHRGLAALGFDTGAGESGIIPILVGDEDRLAAFHNDLRRAGVFTNLVTYPAVRRKECRLRLCVMNSLTRADLDEALEHFARLGRQHGIIP